MIKNIVLSIIRDSDFPICDDCISANQSFNRIQVNKRCSQLLRELYIDRQKRICNHCKKVKQSSVITEVGINYLSKLENKGEISELIELSNAGEFNIDFKFEWISIYNRENVSYTFPEPIDRTNKSKYNKPAIYRWILINQNGEKTQNIYVGEATELAQRIYHYINPGGDQQTNIRLNSLFHELIEQGNSIVVEQLKFEPFEIGKHLINENSLKDKLTRRFLEHLMATFYSHEGYNVINA